MNDQSAAVTDTFRHADGYEAFVRWWTPATPCGAVVYLHGIQSHGGWYEGSGEHLAAAGYLVLMPDRRGSGLNMHERGHADGPQVWLDDLRELIDAACQRAGATSVHVVGVSWGGKLAAAAAAAGIENIASLTLVAPGIYPRIDLPLAEKMRVAWSLVSEPQRAFAIPLDDARLFTGNPERIRYVADDPHRLKEVTGVFLLASRKLDRKAQALPESSWRGPVHLLLAGHERIIDSDKTRAWFRRLPLRGHRLTEFPDAHHTLEFEPDPTPMRECVLDWIDALTRGDQCPAPR